MKVNFKETAAPAAPKVVFESVWAEKAGGGLVKNSATAIPAGTPVAKTDSGLYDVGTQTTAYIEFAALGTSGKYQVQSGHIDVDTECWLIVDAYGTEEFGVSAVNVNASGKQEISISGPSPTDNQNYNCKVKKVVNNTYSFVTGADIPANAGDTPVRLINGANVRKETAPQALKDNVSDLKGIHLV